MSCTTGCKNKSVRNYDRTVRKGETLEMSGRTNDPSVTTVTLKVWDDTGVKLTVPATFVDNKATIEAGTITLPIKDYQYSLTVAYSDGKTDILPNPEYCDGSDDCAFPKLTVCSGGFDE